MPPKIAFIVPLTLPKFSFHVPLGTPNEPLSIPKSTMFLKKKKRGKEEEKKKEKKVYSVSKHKRKHNFLPRDRLENTFRSP